MTTSVNAVVRPDAIRLLEDWEFVGTHGQRSGRPFRELLKAGEIGTYFAHSDCFTFVPRRGWVPFFSREEVQAQPERWEALQPNNEVSSEG